MNWNSVWLQEVTPLVCLCVSTSPVEREQCVIEQDGVYIVGHIQHI